MVTKNPETPREEIDETKRDLNELKSEVVDSEETPENKSALTDSSESLENDPEVKSGLEKILNKSFEDIVSDFEKELTNEFSFNKYMKTIAETHPNLGTFIMSALGLPCEAFLGIEPKGETQFKELSLGQKINFIAFKKSIDKLISRKKDLSKISAEEIMQEVPNQGELLMNEADKYFEGKSASTLKSVGLTDSEYNKIFTFLNQSGIIKENNGGSLDTSDGIDLYGKHSKIFGSKEEVEPQHKGRQAESGDGIVVPARLVYTSIATASAAVATGVCYWIRGRKRESITDTGKTGPTSEVRHRDARGDMLIVPKSHSSILSFRNAETIYKNDTFWNKVKGTIRGKDWAELKCQATVQTGFKGVDMKMTYKMENRKGVLTIDTDRPTVYCSNTNSIVLGKGGSLIRGANKNVQTHAIKLCENAILTDYAGYVYDPEKKKLVLNDTAKQKKIEDECKEYLEKYYKDQLKNFGMVVDKVVVNYRKDSKIKICLEDRNVDELGDDRPKPWKHDKEHYVKM